MITSRAEKRESELNVANFKFAQVNEFKYLGTIVTDKNETKTEIQKRLHSGNACFYATNKLLKSRLLSRKTKIRIYKTIILPVVLYGCETWPLTRAQENRFRVFENKVLRKIFGTKKDEVGWEYRKLHNHELEELYKSPSIVRIIKSRRLRWAGHVARMSEERTARTIFAQKPRSKRPLGRPTRRWKDNVLQDLEEIGRNQVPWTEFAQNRVEWRSCVEAAMNFRVPRAI